MGAAAGGGDRGVSTAGVPSTERWQLLDPKDVGRGAPAALRCPLTHRLFVDPVRAGNGKVYERSAIAEHLQQNEKLPGSSSRATSKASRTLTADAETLAAVQAWLLENPSGTSDAALGGSGHWTPSRSMEETPTHCFTHEDWTTVFLHSGMRAMGFKLSLWEQNNFHFPMAPSASAVWHRMRGSTDGFTSGTLISPSYVQAVVAVDSMSLGLSNPSRVPAEIEHEVLSRNFDRQESTETRLQELCGGPYILPTAGVYITSEFDDQGNDPERKSRMLTVKILF